MRKKYNKCHICGSRCKKIFCKKILDKYDVTYYKCTACQFIQTEKPYWIKEAYNSAIIDTDTGLLSRNITLSKITAILSLFLGGAKCKILDYAGGYGILVRMLRDIGLDSEWSDKYANNIFAKTYVSSSTKKYDIVTAFEVFEHLESPLKEIGEIIKTNKPKSILFSTMVHNGYPEKDWWYFVPEGGQHISLYSKKSLEIIAKKYGYNFVSNSVNLHLFTKYKISSIFLMLISIMWPVLSLFLPFFYKSKTFSDRENICKNK